MDKEKFSIPVPDESIIQAQIEQIIVAGAKRKPSYFSFMKEIYQQVGLRNLFSDRSELFFILVTVITLLTIFLIKPEPIAGQFESMYTFFFVISPVLFIVFLIYTYANKIANSTYEVEMACKYHVYQIIAFRMFAFSVASILFNTMTIFFIAMEYEGIEFFRAVLLSMTGLFLFSLLFLYVMMKRRSTVVTALTVVGWVMGNLFLKFMDNRLYDAILMDLPLYVYVLVTIGCLYFYLRNLNRLLHFKQMEGTN